MTLDLTQANYNLAISSIRHLLDKPSKCGSSEDMQIMMLGRFIEDYEDSRSNIKTFEPYYLEVPQ